MVKIPNGALRYKPDLPADEIRALYQKYGIPETGGRRAIKGATTEAASGSPSGEAAESRGAKYDVQVVWKLLPDKTLEPVRIRTGITDHTFTELVQPLKGELKMDDELVTGLAQGHVSASVSRPGGAGAPRGR